MKHRSSPQKGPATSPRETPPPLPHRLCDVSRPGLCAFLGLLLFVLVQLLRTGVPPAATEVDFASRTVRGRDGFEMPAVGLGTWKSEKGKVGEAVRFAVHEAGYTHIDTSPRYYNEPEVGAVLRDHQPREKLFIASKLWNADHRVDRVEPALERTLKDLGVEYLDLWYMHWPVSMVPGHDNYNDTEFDPTPIAHTWREMEKQVARGRVKALGVSNFNVRQLRELWKVAAIRPVANQIEMHPYLPQGRLLRLCKELGVVVVAYSPLGSPGNAPSLRPGVPPLLSQPAVTSIANRLGVSPSQVLLRWALQRGAAVIPKSVTPSRIRTNSDVWSFELTSADMSALGDLRNTIGGPVRFVAAKHMVPPGETYEHFWDDDGGEL